jgi:cytochrome P450
MFCWHLLNKEELDIVNLMSSRQFVKYQNDDVWMRTYIDKQLKKRRANEAKDIQERFQRLANRSKGRVSDEALMDLAIAEHKEHFRHPVPD